MTEAKIKNLLRAVLDRDLLLDLEDRSRAEALKAFEMVRDHSGLRPNRGRGLEGQARFRMSEQGFEDVCQLHGGVLLDGGVMPGTAFKVFQPFVRFEVAGQGVILGLAAMPDRRTVPAKNKSRLAGVTVNVHLELRLDFDGSGPRNGDVFALLLMARHREKAGSIDEIAVGVIDARYSTFLLYEPIERFLAGYGDEPVPVPPPDPVPPTQDGGVKLKDNVVPFVPPERPGRDAEGKGKK